MCVRAASGSGTAVQTWRPTVSREPSDTMKAVSVVSAATFITGRCRRAIAPATRTTSSGSPMYNPFSLVVPENVLASPSQPVTLKCIDESGISGARRLPRYSEVSCTGPDIRAGPAVSSHSGYASNRAVMPAAIPMVCAADFQRSRTAPRLTAAAMKSPMAPTMTVETRISAEMRNCATHSNARAVPHAQVRRVRPEAIWARTQKMSGGRGTNTKLRCEPPWAARYGEKP